MSEINDEREGQTGKITDEERMEIGEINDNANWGMKDGSKEIKNHRY